MKTFRLKVSKLNKKIITKAIEAGVQGIVCPDDLVTPIKELAVIPTIAEKKGDLKMGKDAAYVKITNVKDEDKVVAYKGQIPVIIDNLDRTIIPLENLISKTHNLIQLVHTAKQAKVALGALERGADGVCLETDDINEVVATGKVIQATVNEGLQLQEVEITEVRNLGMGSRCCIDTASILDPGVGLLVGDSSGALFLAHNENVESPYCDARPFRVNAGAAHAYVRCPDNKTKYLGELQSGDYVLACDPKGNTQTVIVGRNKIEERPLMLVKGKVGEKTISLVLQNAETIRLTDVKGKPVAVTRLKQGDKVLAYFEETGRHFGVQINETIREK